MADVTIAIPTFRRPRGLERLLAALEKLDTTANVSVLVADNDAGRGDGAAVCERLRTRGYRWPLEWIVVRERGIAQTRNALVEHVLAKRGAEFVAMIDDDEWPQPQWLNVFLRAHAETGADVLYGAVLREFERKPGIWAAYCPGVASTRIASGPFNIMPGAGNVLLRRACLEDLPKPCFDPAFALTGGEDKDFFTRLKQQGCKFAGVDDAICTEFVPASRANLRWALKRAYRIGNSDMRVALKYESTRAAMAREGVKIAGAFLLFPVLFAISMPFAARRAMPLWKLYRAAGKLAAVFGSHVIEYANVHGN
jgi:glycosyltransferase involved in cell wall biosynthesis